MLVLFSAVTTWVWVINIRPDKNVGFPVVLAVAWAIYIAESAWGRLVVNPDHVRMISVHRDPPIPRERIYNIRALRCNTVFYDHDGKRVLATRADLSRAQLLALASELGVNVWDHRAWHGLKRLEHGVRLPPGPRPPA
jgi:hypothetical protein